jgi:peptide-methionine (S)-S-oxide reductase
MNLFTRKSAMVDAGHALPGRDGPIVAPGTHLVLGTPLAPPFPENSEQIVVGMGCFWGADSPFGFVSP